MSDSITNYASVVAVAISAENPQGFTSVFFYPFIEEVVGHKAKSSVLWDEPYTYGVRYAPFIVNSEGMLRQWGLFIAQHVKTPTQRLELFQRSVWGVMFAYNTIPPKAYNVLTHLQKAFGYRDGIADAIQASYPLTNYRS